MTPKTYLLLCLFLALAVGLTLTDRTNMLQPTTLLAKADTSSDELYRQRAFAGLGCGADTPALRQALAPQLEQDRQRRRVEALECAGVHHHLPVVGRAQSLHQHLQAGTGLRAREVGR